MCIYWRDSGCLIFQWDTPGQVAQCGHMYTSLYYRGASGALVVFDVTHPVEFFLADSHHCFMFLLTSFMYIQRSFQDIEVWLRQIEEFAGSDICKVLVGNRCDLVSKREVDFSTAQVRYLWISASLYTFFKKLVW